MTGTMTILGGSPKVFEWDTDSPVSVEEAKKAYETTIGVGGQPMNTTGEVAERIRPNEGTPGKATSISDVSVIPQYQGG